MDVSTPPASPLTDPGLRLLHQQLAEAKFTSGARRGWWRIEQLDWPALVVTVTIDVGELTLRVDLTGYPAQPPTAQPWDLPHDQPLPPTQWPTGPQTSMMLNPAWSASVGGALYFPYDRRAVAGHEVWRTQYPGHVWHAGRTLRDYLMLVRAVLRDATFPQGRR